MSLRSLAAHHGPIAFRWLQARNFIPNPQKSSDVRWLGQSPQPVGYRECIVGVHRPSGPGLLPMHPGDEKAQSYEAHFAVWDKMADKDWPFGYFDVDDVKIWPNFGVHASRHGHFMNVYCSTRALKNPKYELSRQALKTTPVRQRHDAGVLITAAWFHNFYHWTVDILPRLQLAAGPLVAGVPLVIPANISAERRAALRAGLSAVGAEEAEIIALPAGMHRFRRLILPTNFTTPLDVSPRQRSFLRSALLPAHVKDGGTTRLYVTRRDAATRRVENEEEIEALLEGYGFETVTLSGLTAAAQAELFARAEAIVGHHGAGFANLAFASPGAFVIEFFQDGHFAPTFARLAQLGQLAYGFLVGERIGQNTRVSSRQLSGLLDSAML